MTPASLRATLESFNADKAPRLAAAIAYSTIFSIAPLFIVLIAAATAILGSHANVESKLYAIVAQNAGTDAADAVRGIVRSSSERPHQGTIAQIVAWVAFAVGASGLFSALQDALNSIWGVEGIKGGWRRLLRDRAASFGMIAVVGFLLLVTFLANGAITIVAADFGRLLPAVGDARALAAIGQVVNFALVSAIFALIFKVLPDVDVAWRDVWFGALVTAVLFAIGEYAIALYFALGGIASAYGAAGSVLVALLWIYYSALILLLGAEFTKIHARRARLAVPSLVRATHDRPAGADPRRPVEHDGPAPSAARKPADGSGKPSSGTIRSFS